MLACLFITLPANGQGFPPAAIRVLDSTLYMLGMSKVDLAMPHDIIKPDKHRPKLQIALFDNPLLMGDVAMSHVEGVNSMMNDSSDAWFKQLMKDGQLGTYTPRYLHDELSAGEIDAMIGHQLDLKTNITTAVILRQYLGPMLQVIRQTEKSRLRLLKDTLLIHQADSLLMPSQESESLSVYAMKQSEIEGMELAKRFFSKADSPKEIIEYGLSLIASYPKLFSIAEQLRDEYTNELQPLRLNTPYGMIAIGSSGTDIYEGNFLLILDPGGNDVYAIKGDKKDALKHPVQCIIDFSGDDQYRGGDFALGSGYFGIGIVHDLAGNDIYTAGDVSLGAGIFGIGYMHDKSGNDIYSSTIQTQGAGFFGIGILHEEEGNDTYTIHAHGQAFASTRGVGILSDHQGNDAYVCSGPFKDILRYDDHFESFAQGAALGYRPIASGGFALLMDHAGNDAYLSDIYGQGTGYWFGFGALVDLQGSDLYKAYQYAQGSGVHLAQGLLWDGDGDDNYVSHGVSQGCGHDIAVGYLLDEFGNDTYTVESLSLGAGNANAISLFNDLRGNDAYIAMNQSNTMGYSDFRRNYGMIGVFADAGGLDIYSSSQRNNISTKQSTYGVFLDGDLNLPRKFISEPVKQDSSIIDRDFGKSWSSMDSLFIRASAAPLRFQSDVEPARKAMIEFGLEALSYCVEHFGTVLPRERLALEYLIPALYNIYPNEVRQELIKACEDDSAEVSALALTLCGKLHIREAIGPMLQQLEHVNWRLRSIAARQLGEMETLPDSALKVLSQRLQDEQYMVRGSAAFAIGKLMPINVLQLLRSAFFEELQIIRNNAIKGMEASKKVTLQLLLNIVEGNEPEKVKNQLTGLLHVADSTIKAKELVGIIAKASGQRQIEMIESTINEASRSERAKEMISMVYKSIQDPAIREICMKSGYIQPILRKKGLKK